MKGIALRIKRRSFVAVGAVAVLSAVVAAADIAVPTTDGGGTVTGVQVVRESAITSANSTSFVDVPGAITSIRVPSGKRALIL